jgi:hypothetical protein
VKKSKPPNPPPAASTGETEEDGEFEKIDWGKEATAGEVVAMAKSGDIREIEWHIMPNILRAVASDGRFFFVRNENNGFDMRGMLVKSGVQVGKGGIPFNHVF